MGAVTAAIVGGAIAAGGTIAASKMSSDAQSDAANKLVAGAEGAANQYTGLNAPTIQEQMIQLEQMKSAGNLTPEQESEIDQQETQLKAIQVNPQLRDAQMQALQKLQQIGDQQGLTAVDRAQLNQIQNQVSNQNANNRNAVLQSYAQRGMAGSGLEQASQLLGSQAASGTAADQGFNVAAQAQQRALQAIQQGGALGSQMENQQFGEQSQIASAQDAINRFNAQNAQAVQGRNVQRTNYANERNLNNTQNIDAQNVGLANQQQIYNNGLYQQDFGNQMQLATARANALNKLGSTYQAGANAQSNLYNAVGNAAGKVGGAITDYGLSKVGQNQNSNPSGYQGTQYQDENGNWQNSGY